MATPKSNLLNVIAKNLDNELHKKLHWRGTFQDYLKMVEENPKLLRSAWQRIYDMLLSHGTEEYIDSKKKIIHYKFFEDPIHSVRDAIFGLDIPLMKMVKSQMMRSEA